MSEENITEKNNYAGFWQRFGAFLIDGMAIQVVFFILSFAVLFIAPENSVSAIKALNILIFIVVVAYEPLMESMRYQATIGKIAAGVKVTSLNGEKISIARAFGRRFAMILSMLPLCLGFVVAAFSQKKQGLHDLLAKTVVVKTGKSYFWRIMAITTVLYIAVIASAGYYVSQHLGAWISAGFNSGGAAMGEAIKSADENKIVEEEINKEPIILPYNVSEAQYEDFLINRDVKFTPDSNKPTFSPAKSIFFEFDNFSAGDKPYQSIKISALPELNLGRGGYAMVKIANVLNNSGADVYDHSRDEEFFQKKFDNIIRSEENPSQETRYVELIKDTNEADIKSVSGTIHLYLPINPKVISISGADVGKPIEVAPDLQINVQKFGNGGITFEVSGAGKNRLLGNFYAYNSTAQLLENSGFSSSYNTDLTTITRQIKGTPTSAQLIIAEKFFEKEYPFTITK
jgi:uncharacterized RDD family membrane protein YckC